MRTLNNLIAYGRLYDDATDGEGNPATPFAPVPAADDGTAKALADAQAKIAAMEKAQAEREAAEAKKRGDFEALYTSEKQRADEAAAEAEKLRKREDVRLGRVASANKDRIKALPEEWRDLVPKGLPQDEIADWLSKAEARVKSVEDAVDHGDAAARAGTPGARPPSARAEADPLAVHKARAMNVMMGRRPEDNGDGTRSEIKPN